MALIGYQVGRARAPLQRATPANLERAKIALQKLDAITFEQPQVAKASAPKQESGLSGFLHSVEKKVQSAAGSVVDGLKQRLIVRLQQVRIELNTIEYRAE